MTQLPTDKTFVVCSRHSGGSPQVAGTRVVKAECGHMIDMSPSSAALIAPSPDRYRLACDVCFLSDPVNVAQILKGIREGNDPLRMAPGALDEIRGLDDVALSDQILATVRDMKIKEHADG